VLDANVLVEDATSSEDPWLHGVQVGGRLHRGRTARIRASYGWVDAFIPELEVRAILSDHGDVEREKEDELRRLCLVMRACLQGEGHIGQRRLFRRGKAPVLLIEVDGVAWRLGRNHCVVP